jgi:riboflavin kinase
MSSSGSRVKLKPVLWFTLHELLRLGAADGAVRVSTTELSERIGCSQQSASRHLRLLERMGLVARSIEPGGSLIRVTENGRRALEEVYLSLREGLEGPAEEVLVIEGTVFSGMNQGAYYLSQGDYREQIREKLGFDPYLGTLNLRLREADLEQRRRLERLPAVVLDGFRSRERAFGGGRCYPAVVNGEVEGAVVVADRTSYDTSVLEVIAPVNLRERFGLRDGDSVRVEVLGSAGVPGLEG